MVRTRSKQGGFTLTEALVTVAIVGIVASVSASLLTQVNRYFILSRTRTDLQKEARGILYIMTRELRQAQSATIVIDRAAANQPFYSRITFTKQQGTVVTFLQKGNVLQQQWGTPTRTETLSKNLRYLAFTFPRTDDMTILSVSMTLQQGIYGGKTKALHMTSQQIEIMN